MNGIVSNALNRGLTIHPLKPRSKEPCLKNWPKQASRDPEVVQRWAEEFPEGNYGVVANDEFCILESDHFRELEKRLGWQIPATYTVQARANRPHLYFRQTAASRAAGNMDLPGIFEFKQNNRYVVAEGSIHPTGAVYTCTQDAAIIPIPDWLVGELIRLRSGSGVRMSAPLPADGRMLGEGEGRHPMLMSQAGKLWDGEKTEEQMFEELQAINEKYCDPPKEAHKLLSMIDWVMARQPAGSKGPQVLIGKPKLEGARVKGTAFDFVLAPAEDQIEGAFPLGSVSLLLGPSGSGKTTLGLQMLRAQRERESFFGHASFGRPYLVIMQDRSEDEMTRTFARMRIDRGSVPVVALTAAQESMPPATVIEEIYLAQSVRPQIVFVEGLDMWSKDQLSMDSVSPLMRSLRDVAQHYHIALIGTVGTPKMKKKERYESPRDCAYGSGAWSRRSDTMLQVSEDYETGLRTVILMPRNAPQERFTLGYKDGLLVRHEPSITVGPAPEPDDVFGAWRAAQPGKVTARDVMKAFKCSRTTAFRWLKENSPPAAPRGTANGTLRNSPTAVPVPVGGTEIAL